MVTIRFIIMIAVVQASYWAEEVGSRGKEGGEERSRSETRMDMEVQLPGSVLSGSDKIDVMFLLVKYVSSWIRLFG